MKFITICVAIVASGTSLVHAWPPGLANCGNTCFLNASLQVLYAADPIRTFFIKNAQVYQNDNTSLGYQLCKLMEDFDKKTKGGKTQHIYDKCEGLLEQFAEDAYGLFTNQRCGSQQDAQECIGELLKNVARTNLVSIYQLPMRSTVTCPKAGIHTKDQVEDMILAEMKVPATGQLTLTLAGCLQEYFNPENNVTLGQETDCTKKLSLKGSPDCIFISIKRYAYDRIAKKQQKIPDRIYIPQQLNLADFMISQVQDKHNYQYQLQAVAIQSGDVTGGHYWAVVRETASKKWYKCDDKNITEVAITSPAILEEIEGGVNKPSGYFFVYQKVAMIPQVYTNWERAERIREAYAVLEKFSFDRFSENIMSPDATVIKTTSTLESALKSLTGALQDLAKTLAGVS